MPHDASTAIELPWHQRTLRAKCIHPTGTFIPFTKDDLEQAIPERFEQQVHRYANHLAVKTRHHALPYAALNQAANRVARAILP